MPTELQLIFDHLDGACCPEDVFGTDHVAALGMYGSGPTAEHRTVDLEVCA